MKITIAIILLFLFGIKGFSQDISRKVRIGIAGMTHGHVHGILSRMNNPDFIVTGIAEKNRDLAEKLFKQYHIPDSLWYASLEDMVRKTRPDGVVAFNSIFGHLHVVEVCAPRHIHVMVEKPLAISNEHARKMSGLAKDNKILLLTNYETTWYPTTGKILADVREKNPVGELRKIVVRDGHQGPKEIGVGAEFLEWLTDPELNGGGALIDFGCYGANLITGLMNNTPPSTVTAVTMQIKPDIYPRVDDEATIVVTYPRTQGIIQASWNWPYGRKDMDIYGNEGAIFQFNGTDMQVRKAGHGDSMTISEKESPENDPFRYFSAAIKGDIRVQPNDLSSLENNLIVVKILDAARRSAKNGETIQIQP